MNTTQKWSLLGGLAVFALMLVAPAPAGMTPLAWHTAALVVLMAIFWMTEALPLTVTALLPFVVLPFTGVMPADKVAAAYYSPILFLVLGGAFIALAIERTGLDLAEIAYHAGDRAWIEQLPCGVDLLTERDYAVPA